VLDFPLEEGGERGIDVLFISLKELIVNFSKRKPFIYFD